VTAVVRCGCEGSEVKRAIRKNDVFWWLVRLKTIRTRAKERLFDLNDLVSCCIKGWEMGVEELFNKRCC